MSETNKEIDKFQDEIDNLNIIKAALEYQMQKGTDIAKAEKIITALNYAEKKLDIIESKFKNKYPDNFKINEKLL